MSEYENGKLLMPKLGSYILGKSRLYLKNLEKADLDIAAPLIN